MFEPCDLRVVRAIEAVGGLAPVGGYVAGMATRGHLLFISGQTPESPGGDESPDADEQLRQVWANIQAVLHGAGARVSDLVHVRTYLADRAHRETNTRVRREFLVRTSLR